MKENILNSVKEIDTQIQEAQRIPNIRDVKRPTPRHIIINMPKVNKKKENLKSSQRKEVSYLQGNSHDPVADF